jgi:hypothetical protein
MRISPRMFLYAGAVAAAAGVVVAGRFSRIAGVCLAVAGLLFALAARFGVAEKYAPTAMRKRNVRLINLTLGAVGVLFVGLGAALIASR